MLVLTLRRGEKVIIGSNVVLTYVEDRRGGIALSFDAPRDIPIDRLKVRHSKEADKNFRPLIQPVKHFLEDFECEADE